MFERKVIEFRSEKIHCNLPVSVLRAFGLACCLESCRNVSDAHCGLSLVYVLSPGPRRSEEIDFQIFRFYFYLFWFNEFRKDVDKGKRRVSERLRVEWGYSHEAMHS